MFLVVPHSAALELRPDLAKLQLPASAKTDGFRTDMGAEKGISLGSFRRRAADFSCVDCTCLRPSDAYIVVSVSGCPAIAAIGENSAFVWLTGAERRSVPFPHDPPKVFPSSPSHSNLRSPLIAFSCGYILETGVVQD